jgi:hypothetical protein
MNHFPALNRLLSVIGVALVGLLLLVPAAAAADPGVRQEHIVVTTGGDITFAEGDEADVLVILDGTAIISGDVRSVVVVNGDATFVGARAEDVVAISSHVALDDTSVIDGDIRTLNATIERAPGATVNGETRDLLAVIAADIGATWLAIVSVLMLIYLGFVAAAVVAGVVVAGVAGRQVRQAGRLISDEPLSVFLAGLAGMFGIITVGVLAIITVIGIPLGVAILAFVLPLLAVAGYLVVGIWIGEVILSGRQPGAAPERPYMAAVVGILALAVISLIPVVGGLVSFMGLGAVVLLLWRNFRRAGRTDVAAARPLVPAAGSPGS